MDDQRLTRHEVENLRRSVGACGQLPTTELRRVLDDLALLLEEREEARRIVGSLVAPWGDVRAALNDLHELWGRRT